MSPYELRLVDLAPADQHLGHKGQGDRDDQPGLIDKPRRQAQQLRLVDPQVKGGKERDQRQQAQRAGDANHDPLQGDRAAHQRPARREAEQDVTSHVDAERVQRDDQQGHPQGHAQQHPPALNLGPLASSGLLSLTGLALAHRDIVDDHHAQQQAQVERIAGQDGDRRRQPGPNDPGDGME